MSDLGIAIRVGEAAPETNRPCARHVAQGRPMACHTFSFILDDLDFCQPEHVHDHLPRFGHGHFQVLTSDQRRASERHGCTVCTDMTIPPTELQALTEAAFCSSAPMPPQSFATVLAPR